MTLTPTVPETYGYPVPRAIASFSVLFFFITCSSALYWRSSGYHEFLWVSGGCLVTAVSLAGYAAWRSSQTITIDGQGITWAMEGCTARTVLWNQVRQLRERPVVQMLEVHGLRGDPVVKIPFALAGFARLRDSILQASPAALGGPDDAADEQLPITFHTSLVPLAGLLGASAFLMIMGFVELPKERVGAMLFFGVGLLTAAIIPIAPHSLIVERDKVVVKSMLRSREIHLADIDAVETRMVDGGRGGVQLQLWLTLTNGKQVKLIALKETLRARVVIERARQQVTLES